jgi:hypothetical protein
MKYTRMLCWVRPQEKKELKEAVNGRFPLVFAKNYDDFKIKIGEGDYLVFSGTRAHNINNILNLVRSFPDLYFVILGQTGDEILEDKAYFIQFEPNIVNGQYSITEIISNYLGEILDLWEYRKNQFN